MIRNVLDKKEKKRIVKRIKRKQSDGETISSCCSREGISTSSFYRWQKELTSPTGHLKANSKRDSDSKRNSGSKRGSGSKRN